MHVSKRAALGVAAAAIVGFAVPAMAGNPHDQVSAPGSTGCNDGTVTWTPTELWGAPNHQLQTINITYTDSDGDADATSITPVGVTDNQTTAGVEDPGSGHTSPDYTLGAPGMGADPATNATTSVQVRDERSGRDGDRIYTIHVQCADTNGNMNAASAEQGNAVQTGDAYLTVTVPHDMGQGSGKK